MSLTYIVGTRGRPQELIASVAATMKCVTRNDTRVLVCVDSDDDSTIDALHKLPVGVIVSIKHREDSRGEKCGRALTEAPGSIYMVGHDCNPILTPGFDELIVEAAKLFPDNIGVVNTEMANASFPTAQAITAGLVAKLGYIYNPDYPYWFIDHEIDDYARLLGRNPFVDIHIEQRRPTTTLRLRELAFWAGYFDCHLFHRRATAHAIIDGEDFIAPQWLKGILKSAHPPVEARSLWINAGVRHGAAGIEASRGDQGPPDEGYLRLKAKALQKLRAMDIDIDQAAA